jgi:hypothetical protein
MNHFYDFGAEFINKIEIEINNKCITYYISTEIMQTLLQENMEEIMNKDFNKLLIQFNKGIKNVYTKEYKSRHKKNNTVFVEYKEFISNVFDVINEENFKMPVSISPKYNETKIIEFILSNVVGYLNENDDLKKNPFAFMMDYFIDYAKTK